MQVRKISKRKDGDYNMELDMSEGESNTMLCYGINLLVGKKFKAVPYDKEFHKDIKPMKTVEIDDKLYNGIINIAVNDILKKDIKATKSTKKVKSNVKRNKVRN